jgi:hypothetical protein
MLIDYGNHYLTNERKTKYLTYKKKNKVSTFVVKYYNKGHNSKLIKEKIIQNTIIREVTLKCNRK